MSLYQRQVSDASLRTFSERSQREKRGTCQSSHRENRKESKDEEQDEEQEEVHHSLLRRVIYRVLSLNLVIDPRFRAGYHKILVNSSEKGSILHLLLLKERFSGNKDLSFNSFIKWLQESIFLAFNRLIKFYTAGFQTFLWHSLSISLSRQFVSLNLKNMHSLFQDFSLVDIRVQFECLSLCSCYSISFPIICANVMFFELRRGLWLEKDLEPEEKCLIFTVVTDNRSDLLSTSLLPSLVVKSVM